MIHPIYILFFILLFITSFISVNKEDFNYKGVLIFVLFFLVFSAVFRMWTGADYPVYYREFKYAVSHMDFSYESLDSGGVEASYYLMSKIIGNTLGLDFVFLTLLYASMSIPLKFYIFNKYSPYPLLSVMFYFMPLYFFEDAGQIRQGLATGIAALSFHFVVKRQLIQCYLIIGLAYFFHKSAIVLLPAFFIYKLNLKTEIAFGLILICIILSPFEVYNYLGPLTELIGGEAEEGYDTYINELKYGQDLEYGMHDIVRLSQILLMLLVDRVLIKKSDFYLKVRTLVITYFCLFYLFRGNTIFAVRATGYYSFYLILIFPLMIYYLKGTKFRNIVIGYFFLYMFLMLFRYGSVASKGEFDDYRNFIIQMFF